MQYRFEHKYLLSPATAAILRGRAAGVLKPDNYGDANGGYKINNIYLDDRFDSYYYAKLLGRQSRDKFRIRYYNDDLSFIRLERKHKEGNRNYKETQRITAEQFSLIKAGNLDFTLRESAPLWEKIAVIHRLRNLRPAAAYSYRRETLTYEAGNVRLAFDSPLSPLNDVHLPAQYDPMRSSFGNPPYPLLLEVKYTAFLPEVVQRIIGGLPLVHTEMSKYAIARERGYV
jgi:hypothetical protein